MHGENDDNYGIDNSPVDLRLMYLLLRFVLIFASADNFLHGHVFLPHINVYKKVNGPIQNSGGNTFELLN